MYLKSIISYQFILLLRCKELADFLSFRKAIDITRKYFETYALEDQDFLGDDEKIAKVLALVPNEGIDL